MFAPLRKTGFVLKDNPVDEDLLTVRKEIAEAVLIVVRRKVVRRKKKNILILGVHQVQEPHPIRDVVVHKENIATPHATDHTTKFLKSSKFQYIEIAD